MTRKTKPLDWEPFTFTALGEKHSGEYAIDGRLLRVTVAGYGTKAASLLSSAPIGLAIQLGQELVRGR